MPTSQPRTLTPVYSIVQLLQPRSVIDIGVGHGKSGVLLREYLDIMPGRYKQDSWSTKIYGVEAFARYHNAIWDYAYDKVVLRDALEGLNELPNVDLIIALDIWEHFERNYASTMLDSCLQKARYLLLSTPKNPLCQGAVFGNPREEHISMWSPADFRKVPYRLITCTTDDWIILLSSREQLPASVRRLASPIFHLFQGLRLSMALWSQMIRAKW